MTHPVKIAGLGIVLACLAPAAAAAPADHPALYAHVTQLQVSGKQALAQLRVPQQVYLASRSASLADLRMFDRNGQPISFAVRTPPARHEEQVSSTEATIFPVHAQPGAAAATSLQVSTSEDGRVIAVKTRSGADTRPGAVLSALVLDLSDDDAAAPAVHALRLTQPAGIANYTAHLAVEVSTDLNHWTAAGDGLVSWLQNADARTLANDRIELDTAGKFRYARLSWRDGTPAQFPRIQAERRAAAPAPRPTESLLVVGKPGRFANDIVYPAAQALPVQSVSLQFGERNVVAPALLGRYVEVPVLKKGEQPRHDFEPLWSATFYRLAQDGKVRSSGQLGLDDAHLDEWVLRPASALIPAPALLLAWEPASIVFLANGAAPYTLAVGRAGVTGVAVNVARIAPAFTEAELARLESATVGPMRAQTVAAPSASEAQLAAVGARSRNLILWAVLAIGVLAVALMARQLMRQIPQQEPPPP
ncbi:DUF3999 family protein [Massilia sp. DWR3-1-1]|uniref:DUF3999 family protein n=1 Tax=Massilia sp. DWR3-1-1 TaxID=2804559 RepID=UPI003CEDFF8E